MPTIAARPPVRVRRPSAPPRQRRAGADPQLRRRTTDVPTGQESLAYRIKGFSERLSGSSLLDTIIYRRLWIPVLAVALIGIVAMQVTTLGINAGIGRTVDKSVLLERENTVLAAEVSRLESSDHLSAAVAGMGMVDPALGSTRYMRADGTVLADEAAPSGDAAGAVAAAPVVAPAPTAEAVPATPAPTAQIDAAPTQQQAPAAGVNPAVAAPTQAAAPTVQPAAPAPPPAASPAAESGGATAGGTSAPTAAVGIR